MKLNAQFADHSEEMKAAGIVLPGFDVAAMREAARKHPRWIHIGPGNIFRVFVARLADELLARGEHWPITAVTPWIRGSSTSSWGATTSLPWVSPSIPMGPPT